PVRAFGYGVLAIVAFTTVFVLLAITILGIPLALLLVFPMGSTWCVGMAAVAKSLGNTIPVEWVHGTAMRELAAGAFVLLLAASLPVVGGLVISLASALGVGAVILVRPRKTPPPHNEGGAHPISVPAPPIAEPRPGNA